MGTPAPAAAVAVKVVEAAGGMAAPELVGSLDSTGCMRIGRGRTG